MYSHVADECLTWHLHTQPVAISCAANKICCHVTIDGALCRILGTVCAASGGCLSWDQGECGQGWCWRCWRWRKRRHQRWRDGRWRHRSRRQRGWKTWRFNWRYRRRAGRAGRARRLYWRTRRCAWGGGQWRKRWRGGWGWCSIYLELRDRQGTRFSCLLHCHISGAAIAFTATPQNIRRCLTFDEACLAAYHRRVTK